jgi:hypothetical protein
VVGHPSEAQTPLDIDMIFFWMDVMQEKHQYSMCVTLRAQV